MQSKEIMEKLLLFKVAELNKAIHNKGNKMLATKGIQIEQMPVLMIPYFMGTISQQEIADTCLRDKSSVLRTITILEGQGLIATAQDPFDKRKKLVQLTKEGKTLAAFFADEAVKADEQLFKCLTTEERKTFEALLMKCSQHITQIS